MDIFISWSGDRSGALALALSKWLRTVNHHFHPWTSEDIERGGRWFETIGDKLANCRVGIVCVTPENLDSPWLFFEAGALSKTLGRSRICPLLLGMLPSAIDGLHRQHAMVVIDNAVLFSPIERDIHGTAKKLTKCQFEVIDSALPLGRELVSRFESVWKSAVRVTELER